MQAVKLQTAFSLTRMFRQSAVLLHDKPHMAYDSQDICGVIYPLYLYFPACTPQDSSLPG